MTTVYAGKRAGAVIPYAGSVMPYAGSVMPYGGTVNSKGQKLYCFYGKSGYKKKCNLNIKKNPRLKKSEQEQKPLDKKGQLEICSKHHYHHQKHQDHLHQNQQLLPEDDLLGSPRRKVQVEKEEVVLHETVKNLSPDCWDQWDLVEEEDEEEG